MLVLSVLASAAVAAILGFVVYLFVGGYSGGSSSTSVTPVLFPIAILLFVVAGLPAMLICGLLWAGYSRSSRRQRDGRAGRGGRQPRNPV
jgi:hypothetical protein